MRRRAGRAAARRRGVGAADTGLRRGGAAPGGCAACHLVAVVARLLVAAPGPDLSLTWVGRATATARPCDVAGGGSCWLPLPLSPSSHPPPVRRWSRPPGVRACQQQRLLCYAPANPGGGSCGPVQRRPLSAASRCRLSPARRAPAVAVSAARVGAPSCKDKFLGFPPPCRSSPAACFIYSGMPCIKRSSEAKSLRGSGLRCQRRRPRAPLPPWRRWHDSDRTSSSSSGGKLQVWPVGGPGSGGVSAPLPS